VSVVTVGAAQLGPIARGESRGAVVKRLVAHLHEAKADRRAHRRLATGVSDDPRRARSAGGRP